MTNVIFTKVARLDVENAVIWYQVHAPAVVTRCRQALGIVVKRISENPAQFPSKAHRTRRALLQHFPYFVLFRETPDATYVVAVFHTSRDPQGWQRRLS